MESTSTRTQRERIDAALDAAMTDAEFAEFTALTAADDQETPRP